MSRKRKIVAAKERKSTVASPCVVRKAALAYNSSSNSSPFLGKKFFFAKKISSLKMAKKHLTSRHFFSVFPFSLLRLRLIYYLTRSSHLSQNEKKRKRKEFKFTRTLCAFAFERALRSFARVVNTGAFIFVVVVSAREHLTTSSRFVFVTV